MKRIISVLLLIAISLFAIASCDSGSKKDKDDALSFSKLEKNLVNAGYNTEILSDEDEIENIFRSTGIEPSEFKVKKFLTATNIETFLSITVIECSSSSNAKKLSTALQNFYNENDVNKMILKVEGAMLLISSSEDAITDALKGKTPSNTPPGTVEIEISDIFYFKLSLEEAGYEVEYSADEDDFIDLLEDVHLNYKNYNVLSYLTAINHDYGRGVTIVECGSNSYATKFKNDLTAVFEENYNGYSIETNGRFVITGTEGSVSEALELAIEKFLSGVGVEQYSSLEDVKTYLESIGYMVSYGTENDLKEAMSGEGVSMADYGVTEAIAGSTTSGVIKVVSIYKCGSPQLATELCNKLKSSPNYEYATDIVGIATTGSYLLIGMPDAIDDVLSR